MSSLILSSFKATAIVGATIAVLLLEVVELLLGSVELGEDEGEDEGEGESEGDEGDEGDEGNDGDDVNVML